MNRHVARERLAAGIAVAGYPVAQAIVTAQVGTEALGAVTLARWELQAKRPREPYRAT
jgi:hypothetical protein